MNSKKVPGIPGLLDQLLSPTTATAPASSTAHHAHDRHPPPPRPGPAGKRPATAITGARRGRPAGPHSYAVQARQKVTFRLPADLIATYRDHSWEARCPVSFLAEQAMREYRASWGKRG
jgi:uncharacterized protein (DUF4415 family)